MSVAELARPLDLQRHEGAPDADEGHDHGQEPQRLGHRERAVEDPQRLGAERAVRRDAEGRAREGRSQRLGHLVDRRARREVDAERRDPAVVPVALVDVAGQEDRALLGGVVVEDAGHGEDVRPAVGHERDGRAALGEAVAEGERLGDDHGARLRLVPHPLGVARGGAVEAGVALPARVGDGEVHLAEGARDAHRAERLDPRDARDRGHLRGDVRGEGREAPRAAGGGRADEDVGPQREVEPVPDGRAEALDHQADADRHRDRDRERGDRDAGAADRAGDRPRGEPAEGADEPSGDRRRQGHGRDGGERGQEREAEDDGEERGEAREERAARGEEQQAAQPGEDDARGGHLRDEPAGAVLEGAATQGLDGLHPRGLEGGGHGGEDARPQAEGHGLRDGRRRERRAGDGEDVVEVVDRLGDQADGTLAEQPAEAEAEERAHRRGGRRLQEHEGEDLAPGRAEEAQRADHRAPLDDAEHHGVVDEEHADDEGEEAERGQVQLEGLGELGHGRGLLARRGDPRALGEERRDPGDLRVGRDQVHASQVVAQGEEPLRGAHVHQHDRLEGGRLLGGARVGDPGHLEGLDPVLDLQSQRAADPQAVARGEGRPDDGGPRVHEDARDAGLGERAAAQVVAEGGVREEVEAEDVQRLAVEVERPGVALDDRRARPDPRLDPDAAEGVLGHAGRPAEHLVGGAPGHRLRAAPEAGLRAGVREVDGDHDGDAEGDAEDHEAGVERPADEVAQAGEEERAGHGGRDGGRAARRGRPRS